MDAIGGHSETESGTGIAVSGPTETASSTNWPAIVYLVLVIIGALVVLFVLAVLVQQKWKSSKISRDNENATAQQDLESTGQQQRSPEPVRVEERASNGCLPQGILTLAPTTAAVIGFSLSVVSNASCNFASISDNFKQELESIGPWSVSYSYDYSRKFGGEVGACSPVFPSDFEFDVAFWCARVSAVLASTFGGIAMSILILSSVWASVGASILRRTVWLFLVGAMCQGLTLLLINSEYCANNSGCNFDNGAVASMIATGYWAVAAFAISLIPLKGSTREGK